MWHEEKETKDFVWSGADQGIASSPHKGIANLQNVNINTESGEVMCSFSRILQSTTPFSGLTLTQFTTNQVTVVTNAVNLLPGMALTIGAGITGLSAGNYYILTVIGAEGTNQILKLTATYNGIAVTGMSGGGTATAASFNVNKPLANAEEQYFDGTNLQYRYYILDTSGYVWVQDTGTTWSSILWTCINIQDGQSNTSGLGYLQGNLLLFKGNSILWKETVLLGVAWTTTALSTTGSPVGYQNPHFCLSGHILPLAYTDGAFIGSITPSSISAVNAINNFSYATYTVTASVITVTNLFAGTFPVLGQTITFSSTGTLDTALSASTAYYVISASYSQANQTFKVSASADLSGTPITFNGDGTGTTYFNSYNPEITATFTQTPQAFSLPPFEITQSLCEIGSQIIVGCKGNTLYPWDTTAAVPTTLINLPENNAVRMISVNNMAYVFTGNKGNIYITNGVTASPVISVPDYCAGIAGTPTSYVEPYFTWGGSDYIRGRVYFSLLDQTATKTGNCGGIWSFVPTQNLFIGQDSGLSLRMENTSSYGTLNGYSPVIMASQNQAAIGVQYFTGWQSEYRTSGTLSFSLSSILITNEAYGIFQVGQLLSIGSGITTLAAGYYYVVNALPGGVSIQISATPNGTPINTFSSGTASFSIVGGNGIDGPGTFPNTAAIIETDSIPTGTSLNKRSFAQQEYKLASPLLAGESMQFYYRVNLTDAWTSCGTVIAETNSLSGYFTSTFQNTQWLQLQAQLIPNGTSTFSGNRLTEIRLR